MPSPILSSSSLAQLGYKLEGTYPTNWGVPQAGNGVFLNMLSESLDYNIKTEESKSIRGDRQLSEVVQLDATAAGSFAFEAQYREYDPFLLGVVQAADYVKFGTDGVGAALTGTLTLASGTITASLATTGTSDWSTLGRGQWFSLIPPAGASAAAIAYFTGRAFRTHLTTPATSTVITVDAMTPINTTLAGVSMIVGAKITSSYALNSNTMKSYTLQVGHSDINVYRQYTGMIVSKMDLKLSVGGIVTGSFDFMGKSLNLLGSTGLGTATDSQVFTQANATKGIVDIYENGVALSATTYIKSAEFSIENTLRVQSSVGVFGAAGIGAGTFRANGKMELYFADTSMYQKFLAGSASSLAIPILDVDGNGYVYVFPRIKYTAVKVQVGGMDQDNMLSVDWAASYNQTAGMVSTAKTVVIYRVGSAANP